MDNQDMQEINGHAKDAAVDAVSNLLYTVTFDLCNSLISKGLPQDKVLEAGNEVFAHYVDAGIKVRKKPAPRQKTQKDEKVAKMQPIDVLKASQKKKMQSVTDAIKWTTHPDDDKYSYSTDFQLARGFPVKNNKTGKIEGVVTDKETLPITVEDVQVAMQYHLECDFESIVR
jgi:hypothetical protein